MNGEDGDYVLALQRKRYPRYEAMLEALSIPANPPEDDITDTGPIPVVKTEKSSSTLPIAVYSVFGATIVLCTIIIGLRFDWWIGAVWMVVMSVATYYWHQWRVS